MAQWKAKIVAALGDSGSVITDVLPGVELIIGEQPPAPELSGDAAALRFRELFGRFVGALAASDHPLVLFLDDLQWADQPSLNLLEGLVTDPQVGWLLLIGSYRDNEVPPSHPVAIMRADIRTKRAAADMAEDCDIELQGLELDDLVAMTADTVRRPADEARSLAELIQSKTAGNPFFVNQFLDQLHASGLFEHDPRGYWTWDLDAIAGSELTDNVVELMIGKVRELEPGCVEVLQLAAAVGGRFDLGTLATADASTASSIADRLWPALQAGLVLPLDDGYRLAGDAGGETDLNASYRFLHDRVQQAAYSTIDEDVRGRLHLSIARAFAGSAGAPDVFAVATQYQHATALITAPPERAAAAQWFADAGRKARLASVHAPAIDFFTAAAELLDAPWEVQYELAWSTWFQRAASEYLGGDKDVADGLIEELLSRSRTDLERMQVYNLQVEILANRSNFREAVNTASRAVALAGIKIPADPGMPAMLLEVVKTQFLVRKTAPRAIAELPEASDPMMVMALKLLNNIAAAAFFINSNLGSIVLLKMAQTSYRYGNSPDSAFAWGCYAMVVGPILGDFAKAHEYNEGAKLIAQAYPDPGQLAKIPSAVAGLMQHWSHDQRSAIPLMMDGFAAGLEAGDPLHAHYVAVQMMNLRLLLGEPLHELDELAQRYLDHATRYGIDDSLQSLHVMRHLVRCLSDVAQPPFLGADEAAEAVWKAELEGYTSKLPIHCFAMCKGLMLLVRGDPAGARPWMQEARGYDAAVTGNPQYTQHWWLGAVIDLLVLDTLPPGERKKALKAVRSVKKKVDAWAASSPLGFTHKKLYLEAELAWLGGDSDTATRLIDEAIDAAVANSYPNDEAILNERAVAFHASRRRVARVYLRAARAAWERCGALAAVQRLDEAHPELALLAPSAGPLLTSTSMTSGTSTTTSTGSPSLDLLTVLRANEVVAREIVTERLLERLLGLALENAGARRAMLILGDAGALTVRAERLPDADEVLVVDRPVDGADDLSAALVNLVARTRRPVLVADTANPGTLTACPYIRGRHTRSILAVPLVHSDKLAGVMYLENELTTGAFTNERLELLNLLSAQIAISIENAALYANSEALAGAFARFVPQQFLTFLGKESVVDVGLGDSVQRSMTVLFSDIRSFTSLSEGMTPQENFAFLNEYLARVGPVIRQHDGFIDKYIGDAVMALFPNSVDDAVRAALAMQDAVAELNLDRASRGLPEITIGVGLHHGSLMLGTIGEEERIDSTVISDAVNTASRLEGLTKTYGSPVLISGTTLEKLTDAAPFETKSLGEVELRGRAQTTSLHEIRRKG
ncbi:MAG: AAA family ATPase [Proteobacteria bacterium]|nr:AAA family ATPase [Pseudomonadota bacterium]